MSPATTCTNHCSHCGRHFHSVLSFDMHRTGDFASNDPETGRHCLSPFDVLDKDGEMRLESLTESGECRIYEPTQIGVTVWTVRGARERAGHRFRTGVQGET